MEDQPESSIIDEQVDVERSMARIDAPANYRIQMELKKPLMMLQGERLGLWSSR